MEVMREYKQPLPALWRDTSRPLSHKALLCGETLINPSPAAHLCCGGGLRRGHGELIGQGEAVGGFVTLPLIPSRKGEGCLCVTHFVGVGDCRWIFASERDGWGKLAHFVMGVPVDFNKYRKSFPAARM